MDASTLKFIMELADLLGKAPCIPVLRNLNFVNKKVQSYVLDQKWRNLKFSTKNSVIINESAS